MEGGAPTKTRAQQAPPPPKSAKRGPDYGLLPIPTVGIKKPDSSRVAEADIAAAVTKEKGLVSVKPGRSGLAGVVGVLESSAVPESQGIPLGKNANEFLPEYAFADFKHDFSGDKITTNVLNDIETQGSRATFYGKISTLIGQDVYNNFKQFFRTSLPAGAAATGPDGKTEDALLADLDIRYDALIGSVSLAVPYQSYGRQTFTIKGITKNYMVTNVVEKAKPEGAPAVTYNLLSCLSAASGGKQKFAIMYDAGVVGTSKIASAGLPPFAAPGAPVAAPTAEYEVYFINSSENLRDPAPKIVERTFDARDKAPNVSVYFLNDYGHHAQYKTYAPGGRDQTSNLYSAYTLTTVRGAEDDGEKIRGTITYSDGSSEQLDDVKHESEIGSCTIRALSKFLNSGVADLPRYPNGNGSLMSSFMLKRSGDWCQALCLLDKQRVYSVSGYGEKASKQVTLQQLEDENVDVILMTHDRVLLAYALTLGVNVCFTNNRPSGHWITYFKNDDVFKVDDLDLLTTDADRLQISMSLEKTKIEGQVAGLTAKITDFKWATVVAGIVDLRRNAYILANLPSVETVEVQRATIQRLTENTKSRLGRASAVPTQTNPTWKEISNLLGELRNLIPSAKSTLEISQKFLTPDLKYPDQDDEMQTVLNFRESIAGSRPFKVSHKNAASKTYNLEMAFTLIAERLMDDLRTADVPLPAVASDDIANVIAVSAGGGGSRSQITIVRGLLDTFRTAAKKGTWRGPQTGGSGGGLLAVSNYLITRLAVPTFPAPPPPGTEFDTIGFLLGTRMRHYDGWEYFVFDNYIVTKEFGVPLGGVILLALRSPPPPGPAARYLEYLMFRYLVVNLDILYNETKSLRSEVDIAPDFDAGEGNPILGERERINRQTKILTDAVDAFFRRDSAAFMASITLIAATEPAAAPAAAPRLLTEDETLALLDTVYARLVSDKAAYSGTLGEELYALETRLASDPAAAGAVVLLQDGNPATPLLFVTSDPRTHVFIGDYQLFMPAAVVGSQLWASVATGVYVPLGAGSPQDMERYDEKMARLAGDGDGDMPIARGGGRRPLYRNDRVSRPLTNSNATRS